MRTAWRIALIVVLLLVIAIILRAAQDPDRPRHPGYPIYLSWLTVQPKLGPFGEPVQMVMGFEFSQVEMQASGNLEVKTVATIQHDLMTGSGSVLVGDVVYEDREAAAILEAIALREYRKAFPSALPTRRKGLRTVP